MLRRLILAAALLFSSVAAQAVSFTGPLIQSAIPDKSRYAPGDLVTIPVVLNNKTGASVSGSVSCQMSGRGQPVNDPSVASFASLANGATTTVNVYFQVSTFFDYRGYLVLCTAANGGTTYDTASTAIDVSSDWAKYARECMVEHHAFVGTDVAAEVRGLRAYHCSVGQYMDVYWKSHLPYNPGLTWPSLEGVTMTGQALRSYIAETNKAGIASFFFSDWALANADFQTDGSGVSLSWGLYREPINPTTGASFNCFPGCTAANLARTPTLAGGTFPSPPWTTPWFYEMDPTNGTWQNFWISANKPMVNHYGFTGCQIDTLGDMGQTAYNRFGGTINYASAASGFVNTVLGPACRRGTFNNVSGDLGQDAIQNSTEDFYYSERHPEFGDGSTFAAIHDSTGVLRTWNPSKAIDYAIYINECLSQAGPGGAPPACGTSAAHCSTAGGPDTCYFNEPGLRLSHAVVLASGAWNNNFIDGNNPADDPLYISNIFAVSAADQLSALPSTKQAMLDYTSFGVAQEKLLRDQSIDATTAQPATVTSGACTSGTTGAAGTVYMIDKARPGLQIVSLINLCNQTSVDSQDRYGLEVAPTTYTNVAVKMYYANGATGTGAGTIGAANRLWFASPDLNHGAPLNIAYSKGSDGGGTFITFTLPSLQYWSMVWLELDTLASSDYATP